MAVSRLTSPDGELITLEQAKAFARVDTSEDDELINEFIRAAREAIEGPEGTYSRVWLESEWQLVLDEFPAAEILIPLAPVQSVVSVRYYDEDGVLQTIDSSAYVVDTYSTPPWLLPAGDSAAWPATNDAANAVIVRFVAGYPVGTESEGSTPLVAVNVPSTVRLAARQLVAHWYDNRHLYATGTPFDVPEQARTLLRPYRLFLP